MQTVVGRAQQKVPVQANGQETEERNTLAGRQKPNSNNRQARPPRFFCGSAATEAIPEGWPRAGGRDSDHPAEWCGMKGTEGASGWDRQILTASVFPTWICVQGISVSKPERLLRTQYC